MRNTTGNQDRSIDEAKDFVAKLTYKIDKMEEIIEDLDNQLTQKVNELGEAKETIIITEKTVRDLRADLYSAEQTIKELEG